MSLEIIRDNLKQLINNNNNSVIALSGKWGTGKSHLWKNFKEASTEESIQDSLYISLFGIKDIAQLKVKIVQSVAGESSKSKMAIDVAKYTKEALKLFHKEFGALDDIALLAVPSLLKDRFVVIDDIERKHEKFDVEEILGFIDEFTQNYNTRFLLILNNDKLADKGKWDQYREKVIDHELSIQITPSDAFDIAVQKISSEYNDLIKKSIETCKVNNIRIIHKIIRNVNHLIQYHDNLNHDVLERLIPSTVLLSALHYKGIENGPTVEFILKYNTFDHALSRVIKDQEEGPDEAKWLNLLEQLQINSCDDYENLVIAYLKSGSIDLSKVNAIIDQYVNEGGVLSAEKHMREFFTKDMWHPELTESELLEEARQLLDEVHLLGPFEVTILFNTVKDYPGGQEIADRMITNWLDHFNEKDHSDFGEKYVSDVYNRELHPRIEEVFQILRAKLYHPISLFDVALKIVRDSGWGRAEENAMKNSTPELFIVAIKGLTGENLKIFLFKNIDLYIKKQQYLPHFGSGMDNFAEACKTIYNEDKNSRISKIIKRVFNSSDIGSVLEV